MTTIDTIKLEVNIMMNNGGPKTKDDFKLFKIWKALNTKPRPRKDHGAKGKKVRVRKAKA